METWQRQDFFHLGAIKPIVLVRDGDGRDIATTDAEHADLIVAAPALLAACEQIAYIAQRRERPSGETYALIVELATAAIAKARGERSSADPNEAPDPETVRDLLLLAGVDVPIGTIRNWSPVHRESAVDWAAAAHLAASDNDVTVPDKPALLE